MYNLYYNRVADLCLGVGWVSNLLKFSLTFPTPSWPTAWLEGLNVEQLLQDLVYYPLDPSPSSWVVKWEEFSMARVNPSMGSFWPQISGLHLLDPSVSLQYLGFLLGRPFSKSQNKSRLAYTSRLSICVFLVLPGMVWDAAGWGRKGM